MTQLLDIIAKPVRRDVIINGGVVSRFVPSVLCGPPGAFSAPLARHLAFASAANGKRTLLLTDDGNAVAEWSTWAEVTKAPAWARSLLTVVHEAQTNDWCRSHRGFGRMAAIRELTPKLAPQIVVSDFLGTAPLGLFAHEASTYLEIASRFMEDDGAGVLLAAHTGSAPNPPLDPALGTYWTITAGQNLALAVKGPKGETVHLVGREYRGSEHRGALVIVFAEKEIANV